MGGKRFSATAFIPPAPLPDAAFVTSDAAGGSFWVSIWQLTHDAGALECIDTRQSTFTFAAQFGSPILSPDRTMLLYSTVPQGGVGNGLYVRASDDSSLELIASYANGGAGGVNVGLQGEWHPDGTSVIYVETVGPSDTSQNIRKVNVDGTGDVSLLSYNRSADGYVTRPAYNFDGSRIAFYADPSVGADKLYTMLADGSGLNNFATRVGATDTPIAWANTQDVMAWWDAGAYKIADGDGSGITTLWTDPNPFWGNTRVAWLPDDSGLVVLRRIPADPDPEFVLTVIAADGGGITDISPERRSRGGRQQVDLPRVYNGRIYWAIVDPAFLVDTKIVSVLPDGSDYTVEHTMSDITGNQGLPYFDGREIPS